jgi:predicted nucleic acid-binding protein
MEWVSALRGSVVGLDTAPLIYLIEENPTYVTIVDPFFGSIERSEITAVTFIVTLLEVLVHPIQRNDVQVAQKYRDILLGSPSLTTVLLGQDIAEEAARLRATYKILPADAIQLATAIKQKASFFLTNDRGYHFCLI